MNTIIALAALAAALAAAPALAIGVAEHLANRRESAHGRKTHPAAHPARAA